MTCRQKCFWYDRHICFDDEKENNFLAVLLHKTLGIQVPMYLFQKDHLSTNWCGIWWAFQSAQKMGLLTKSAAGHLQLANGLDFRAFTWPYRPFIIDPWEQLHGSSLYWLWINVLKIPISQAFFTKREKRQKK